MTDHQEEDAEETPEAPGYKLYSTKAVALGTFLGGPLAAGVLMRRNFLNLGQRGRAKLALGGSVLFTVALFSGLFFLPEKAVDSIPSSVFAGLYTAIAYQLMVAYQGRALKLHEQSGGALYSGWKTFGVGLGSLVGTVLLMFAVFLTFEPGLFSYESYNSGIERFNQAEARALGLYDILSKDESTDEEVARFIRETGIPAWRECDRILDELDKEKFLDDELKKQNEKLRRYVAIRLKIYKTLLQAAEGEGDEEKLTQELKNLQAELDPYLE